MFLDATYCSSSCICADPFNKFLPFATEFAAGYMIWMVMVLPDGFKHFSHDPLHGSLMSATLIAFVGPLSAIGAILGGIDYSGLDHVMVFACEGLFPFFGGVLRRK
ncbi:hypothetical protein CASFOL_014333 [Castilleja foliolosa]|uniref:Uncharacterized protein n=1 Tax=Castilleja foliolosa TaxID=1961234 RepID=A0ABD3DN61_9LAMI